MKKLLAMILATLMLLTLVSGCGSSAGEEDTLSGVFTVGFGQSDISPTWSIYLRGYGEPQAERMSTGVAEPIYVNCVAFTDEDGKTILFLSSDLLLAYRDAVQPVREDIAAATGVPVDQVMFHCTHNHSGPDLTEIRYNQMLREKSVEAAKMAMADRKPAQMSTGFTRLEKVNFVRHYLLTDGSFMGEGVGAVPKNQLVGHTDAPDNLLQVVQFTREDAKDIVLVNWQGHPKGTAPNPHTMATSNYPGILRRTVETELDCHSLFVLGGSGNMNNSSQIPGEEKYETYLELGEGLGKEVVQVLQNMKPAQTGKFQIAKKDFSYGTTTVPLYAFSIGDLAFATAPFEIFKESAVAVRESSKFGMTFYASCSNESHGYLSTPPSYAYFSYESGSNPMGIAEGVQENLTALVEEIFVASGNAPAQWEEGYHTPAFEPFTDGVEYINPAVGDNSAYKEVKNGYYQITLLVNGQLKTMLAANEAAAQEVISQSAMKLMFNEQNVIIGIVK